MVQELGVRPGVVDIAEIEQHPGIPALDQGRDIGRAGQAPGAIADRGDHDRLLASGLDHDRIPPPGARRLAGHPVRGRDYDPRFRGRMLLFRIVLELDLDFQPVGAVGPPFGRQRERERADIIVQHRAAALAIARREEELDVLERGCRTALDRERGGDLDIAAERVAVRRPDQA